MFNFSCLPQDTEWTTTSQNTIIMISWFTGGGTKALKAKASPARKSNRKRRSKWGGLWPVSGCAFKPGSHCLAVWLWLSHITCLDLSLHFSWSQCSFSQASPRCRLTLRDSYIRGRKTLQYGGKGVIQLLHKHLEGERAHYLPSYPTAFS